MHELLLPLKWNELDRLLGFLDQSLSKVGQPAVLKLWVEMIAEEVFQSAVAAGGNGIMVCRIQPESRLAFRIDGAQNPVDLRHLPGLGAWAGLKNIRITPGKDSCMVQWG